MRLGSTSPTTTSYRMGLSPLFHRVVAAMKIVPVLWRFLPVLLVAGVANGDPDPCTGLDVHQCREERLSTGECLLRTGGDCVAEEKRCEGLEGKACENTGGCGLISDDSGGSAKCCRDNESELCGDNTSTEAVCYDPAKQKCCEDPSGLSGLVVGSDEACPCPDGEERCGGGECYDPNGSLRCCSDGVLAEDLQEDCYKSCADARDKNTCGPSSGVVSICPSGNEAMDVYCDQQTDGGGWMLLYAYDHEANSQLPLNGNKIPLSPNRGYSHFHVNMLPGTSESDIDEVRFYCTTSGHPRIMHFKTDHPFVRGVAFDGNRLSHGGNSPAVWKTNTALLPGHTAVLPMGTTNIFGPAETVDAGFHQFPFYSGSSHVWSIRSVWNGEHPRFECDDYIRGSIGWRSTDTLHQVWVRMKNA